MAELYRAYGADYSANELKANYDGLIKRQEENCANTIHAAC